MITREELEREFKQVEWEVDELHNALDNALKPSMSKRKLVEMINEANYKGLSCSVSSLYYWVRSFKNRISECLDEIERLNKVVSAMPKLQDYMMAFDQIQVDVKRWDKILFPEDYKSNED